MKRYLIIALTFGVISAFALIALADPAVTSPGPSWNEHPDLMAILIGGLITLVCFLMVRTLNKIDQNQNRLFEKLDAFHKQVDTLQGEHNMMKHMCAGGTSRECPE